MEIDENMKELLNHIQSIINVDSSEFSQMVNNFAASFEIVQHTNPITTLHAINRHIAAIKAQKTMCNETPDHMIKLTSVEMGAQTTNSPKLDNAIRILRLKHGMQLREAQTEINKLIADVQKTTANPKSDLNLGRIGR